MFDIGSWEILVVGIVMLIVVGPERLPGLATKAGRWIARVRRFVSNVKNDIDREIRQERIKEALGRDADLDEIRNIINDSKYMIEDEITSAQKEYVVAARDDDPGRDEASKSQQQQLKEQEQDFDSNDNYGLTDHTDNSSELDREYERQQAELAKAKSDNGERDSKSNG